MGFGKSSRLHAAKRFKISADLPIVVELVDSREKIEAFLPVIDVMIDSGLATLERAEVIFLKQDPPTPRSFPQQSPRCAGPSPTKLP